MTNTLTGVLLAAAAGLNAFLPLLGLALADRFSDLVSLDQPYDIISTPLGIAAMLLLATVDLVADKIPRIDHMNDLVNSAIRPAAGMFLVMAVTDGQGEIDEIVAMFLGLVVAGTVHAGKAIWRTRITIASNGIANPLVSMVEDGVAGLVTILALTLPWLGAAVAIPAGVFIGWLYRSISRSSGFAGSDSSSTIKPKSQRSSKPLALQRTSQAGESVRAED